MSLIQSSPDIGNLKREALDLAAQPRKSFHAFARSLWAAHEEDRTFISIVEQVSGLKRRALFYLLDVGELIERYNITEAQAEQIGWTKLEIVARHAKKRPSKPSQRTMRANLKLAMQTTAHALPAALEGPDKPSQEKPRSVLLRLTAEHYAEVDAALISFGAQKRGRGSVGKEEALLRMVRSLSGNPTGEETSNAGKTSGEDKTMPNSKSETKLETSIITDGAY